MPSQILVKRLEARLAATFKNPRAQSLRIHASVVGCAHNRVFELLAGLGFYGDTMPDLQYQMVLTTCPDAQTAEIMARALVEEGLAACVNVLPPMRSIYRWRGSIESAAEQLLIAKIRAADYAAVEQCIQKLHPYELPEVIAIPIASGLPGYLSWLENPYRTE